jgi:pyruvate,orthophosphate dikinase
MPHAADICSLDYLIGTVATAYKGVIISLVARDFCMTEADGAVTIKGTVISMPAGEYQACLIRDGVEVSRTQMDGGAFVLRAESGLIGKTKNLQVDILQKGRHIGTFLLKREKTDDVFISALELSEELRGINFPRLTSFLRKRPGLLGRAEGIISQILSTKKDWERFSEELHSFSIDLFWADSDAYASWYRVLVRHSLMACEKIGGTGREKAVSNFLSLIGLPLEHEPGRETLVFCTEVWLREAEGSTADLSCNFSQAGRVIAELHERIPSAAIGGVLTSLFVSLEKRLAKSPVIHDTVRDMLKEVLSPAETALLDRYGEKTREETLRSIRAALALLREKSCGPALKWFPSIEANLFLEADMVDEFFGVVERGVGARSAETLLQGLFETFPSFERLSPESFQRAVLNTVAVLKRLAKLGLAGACESLLVHVEKGHARARDEVVLNPDVAGAILSAGDDRLLRRYKEMVMRITVPAPRVEGFSGETWAEIVDPRHLERLAKFLHIIRIDSGAFREILVHLLCNIYFTGVYIPDDALFQRDVSSYLNSEAVREDFLLSYMLLRKFPVYYSEVGATGRLRDDTTEIDSWGNDPVLYFVRKQVHVNASNYNVRLVEAVLRAWVFNDPGLMREEVPPDVRKRLNVSLLAEYSSAIRGLLASFGILEGETLHIERIAGLSEGGIRQALEGMDLNSEISTKIRLLCMIYQRVVKKYSHAGLPAGDSAAVPPGPAEILVKAGHLKEVIISPESTSPHEELYFKRHIAFGIPSVMGSYHEPKLDAVGALLRLDEGMRIACEDLIVRIREKDNSFFPEEAKEWTGLLDALNRQFYLYDLGNFRMDELSTVLRTNTLYLSQVVDILRIWQKELTWTVDFFYRTFHGPLIEILKFFPRDALPERFRGPGFQERDFADKAADVVLRDMVSAVPGLAELDSLLGSLLEAFNRHVASGNDEKLTQADGQSPAAEYFAIDALSDHAAARLAPALGGKAKNLVYLTHGGLSVPTGIVFSSDITHRYREYVESDRFDRTLKSAVKEMEDRTGTVFGGGQRPLFLSVRSGSFVSMPGILSSILYCGMNGTTRDAFIRETGDPYLGWDSYRRFIEHYGTVVCGLDPKVFEEIRVQGAGNTGALRIEDLDAGQLEEVAVLSLGALEKRGFAIPVDVYAQLKRSVMAVYRSWNEEKAVQFRRAMNVSDHWGTSVTLMQMVSGNEAGAGASVFFTRIPFSLEKGIYGDTRERASGTDIVAGRLVNRPLSARQEGSGQKSLEETDPELFHMHEVVAEMIEKKLGGLPQEVEATYTRSPRGGRIIYVLQTRRMEFHRGFTRRFDDVCRMGGNVIGRGAGVHGGALTGVVTFAQSPDLIKKLKAAAGLPVILLRSMANTDDVSLMPEVDGIITTGGGVASHASVLAQKFELTAVVGCSDMEIGTDDKGEKVAKIGRETLSEGSYIGMDGSTGLVYSGLCLLTGEGDG